MSDWIEDAERSVAAGLVKMANQGSVPAAAAVLKLLTEKRSASAAETHAAKLRELETNPAELARYLGTLGQNAAALAAILGRPPSTEENYAWRRGQLDRAIETRAIELHQARTAGKVQRWMAVAK